jgi:uncharacterized protein (TIGR02284 family)
MTNNDIDNLRELVQSLNDGVEFYQAAIDKSELPQHKIIFQRMARARVAALSYLQPFIVQQEGSPELGHTFGSTLHKMYPDILYGLNTDHDTTLIHQLELVEKETLSAMQKAMRTIQSQVLKSVLLDLYPRLNRCHQTLWHLDKTG